MDAYYIIIDGLSIIVHVMLFSLVYRSVLFTTMNKKSWLWAYAFTIFVLICEIGTIYFGTEWNSNRIGNIIFCTLGFACSPLICMLLTNALGNFNIINRPMLFVPTCINAVFCILSPWFGFVFKISQGNGYTRGPLFWVFLITYLFNLFILIATTIHIMSAYSRQRDYFFMCLVVFIIMGTSIQVFWPEMQTAWLSVCFGNCLYYIYFCEKLQYYDAVTRLLNRQAYEHKKLELSSKEGACIIMLDIDDFKDINDCYGHINGDKALEKTAKIIKNTFGKFGDCYRIGGDEFCVISNITDEDEIQQKVNEFHDIISTIRKRNREFPGISLDYYIYNKSRETLDQAMSEADARLYSCKKNKYAE